MPALLMRTSTAPSPICAAACLTLPRSVTSMVTTSIKPFERSARSRRLSADVGWRQAANTRQPSAASRRGRAGGGRTHAQARKWPCEQVGARGLDAHAWDACARTHGATYSVERSADALVELAPEPCSRRRILTDADHIANRATRKTRRWRSAFSWVLPEATSSLRGACQLDLQPS